MFYPQPESPGLVLPIFLEDLAEVDDFQGV